MEVFCVVLFFLTCFSNFFIYNELQKISDMHKITKKLQRDTYDVLNELCNNFEKLDDVVIDCQFKLNVLSEELKAAELPNRPIKPNNWDSVREAFKGTTREINERT